MMGTLDQGTTNDFKTHKVQLIDLNDLSHALMTLIE